MHAHTKTLLATPMAEEELAVYLDGTPIGTLRQNTSGSLSFVYEPDYQQSRGPIPLSLSMPIARSVHPNKATRAFITGLLPDSEQALQRLGREYGVSPNNPFALLRHVGMDAAGAVQVLVPGVFATDAANRQGDIAWLTDSEVEQILVDVAKHPRDWNPGRDAGRWSLAGAQAKVALYRSEDGRWGIPRDSTPTTHILKPSMPDYDGHHLNEHLCLRAAQILGMTAATTEVMANDRTEVLISHRYDRRLQDGRWMRLHQEDMCQALSVHPRQKYQSDGGPGVADIAGLLRGLPSRARLDNTRRFFDYLVYNVAICAPDAHAKNFGLLLGRSSVRLAPLYDVASYLPYDQEPGVRSAMKIGENWEIAKITTKDWATTGRRLGLPVEDAVARMKALREKVPKAFHDAANEDRVPEPLRKRALRIADLVTAHVENRRDRWGRVDTAASSVAADLG